MNKEHPYIELIKSNDSKLMSLGYKMIIDTISMSIKLGIIGFKGLDGKRIYTFKDTSKVTRCNSCYEWDFGDDYPKVFTKDAVHEFKSGIYTITHRVTNKHGTVISEQELRVN